MAYTPTDYAVLDGTDELGDPAPTATVAKLNKGEVGIADAQATADAAQADADSAQAAAADAQSDVAAATAAAAAAQAAADAAQDDADTALAAETVNVVATSSTAQTLPAPLTQAMSHITLTANCAITLPTPVPGTTILLAVKQDATGNRTRSWAVAGGGTLTWLGGLEPTATLTANKTDLYAFTSFVSGAWIGADAGRNA